MGFDLGLLQQQVQWGILAQRKLDGDLDVYGPSDYDELKRIVAAGSSAEKRLTDLGHADMVEYVKKQPELQ